MRNADQKWQREIRDAVSGLGMRNPQEAMRHTAKYEQALSPKIPKIKQVHSKRFSIHVVLISRSQPN